MTSLVDAAKEYAKSRKVGFSKDRRKSVGASEIGLCARRVAMRKLGLVPDKEDDIGGFALRGDIMEDNFSAPMMKIWAERWGGKQLYAGQADQLSLAADGVPLSATPDSLCVEMDRKCLAEFGVPDIGPDRTVVAEFKSVDPRIGKDSLPKKPNLKQTLQQLGLIRAAGIAKPDYGLVVYVNASDYFDIKGFPVRWDAGLFKGLIRRGQQIMACSDPNEFQPEGKVAGGHECGQCEYAKSCLGFLPWVPDEDPRTATSAQVKIVEKVAKKVKAAEAAAEKAKLTKLAAEAELYETLNKVGKRFVRGSNFAVQAKTTSSQSRYSIELLKARVIELGGTHDDCKSETKPGTSLSVEAVG